MTLVQFFTGTKEQLDVTPINAGCIYFITDANEIYLDTPSKERICFSSSTDLDSIYTYFLEKVLSDPNAVFKGATETEDGTVGLVPAPQMVN